MVHRYTHCNMLRGLPSKLLRMRIYYKHNKQTLAGLTKILLDRFVDGDMSILLPGNYC